MKELVVTLGITSIWVWLRRENKVFKVPRLQHSKSNTQAYNAFKKLHERVSGCPDPKAKADQARILS